MTNMEKQNKECECPCHDDSQHPTSASGLHVGGCDRYPKKTNETNPMQTDEVRGNMIDTVILRNVEVQCNGIIRNEKGRYIGRLIDDIKYEGEHIKGLAISDLLNDKI